MRDRSRKTLMIAEVLGVDHTTGTIQLNPLYEFREDREKSDLKHVVGKLERTDRPMRNTMKLQMAGFPTEV